MSKEELEVLWTACKARIDEALQEISEMYGGKNVIIMSALEAELLNCQSGGMPLDIRTFRELLRRLAVYFNKYDEKVASNDSEIEKLKKEIVALKNRVILLETAEQTVDISFTLEKTTAWRTGGISGYDNHDVSTWQFNEVDLSLAGFELHLKHSKKINNQAVTDNCKIVSIESTDESIITFDAFEPELANNAVITLYAVKEGTATVTVTCEDGRTVSKTLTVTVSKEFTWSDGTKNKTVDSGTSVSTRTDYGVLTVTLE